MSPKETLTFREHLRMLIMPSKWRSIVFGPIGLIVIFALALAGAYQLGRTVEELLLAVAAVIITTAFIELLHWLFTRKTQEKR